MINDPIRDSLYLLSSFYTWQDKKTRKAIRSAHACRTLMMVTSNYNTLAISEFTLMFFELKLGV